MVSLRAMLTAATCWLLLKHPHNCQQPQVVTLHVTNAYAYVACKDLLAGPLLHMAGATQVQ